MSGFSIEGYKKELESRYHDIESHCSQNVMGGKYNFNKIVCFFGDDIASVCEKIYDSERTKSINEKIEFSNENLNQKIENDVNDMIRFYENLFRRSNIGCAIRIDIDEKCIADFNERLTQKLKEEMEKINSKYILFKEDQTNNKKILSATLSTKRAAWLTLFMAFFAIITPYIAPILTRFVETRFIASPAKIRDAMNGVSTTR